MPPSADQPRVFISYSRRDGLAFARALSDRLAGEGLSLYRDLTHLEGGVDWWRQVEEAIRTVEHVVLVLTPAALASPHVAREWRLARQEGKQVSPIQGPGWLDFGTLPSWMERAHRYDTGIKEQYDRLVAELRTKPEVRRVPFMADALPADFVARPAEFEALKKELRDARGDPVAITAALRGAGGYGKTALANALCHDSDIQDAFADGILRVTLGEKPGDLLGRIDELVKILTGERRGFATLEAAKMELAEALDDRLCLLVIDDVWAASDLAPFLHRGPKDRTTRLITTRDDAVLPKDAARIRVDAMTGSQAEAMLARGLPAKDVPRLRRRLASLAARLGEWPLLLDLANAVLQSRVAEGESPAEALAHAERALDERGITVAFMPEDSEERRRTAAGTLAMSLDRLRPPQRERFAELAVFVEDAEIPIDTAIGLWRQTNGLKPIDGDEMLTRLGKLSLLLELDRARRIFRLHDVVRALLRADLAEGRLAELDRHLVAHYRHVSGGSLAALTEDYALRHLVAHLRGGGDGDAAATLLVDPAWMTRTVERLGVQPLITDCSAATSHPFLPRIAATLALAASIIGKSRRELLPQLLGRLGPDDAPGLRPVLDVMSRQLPTPSLRPWRPTLTPAGAELRRFEGHKDGIMSVIFLPDGRRALSGSFDRTLRLWDLETGAELRRFEGHKGIVRTVSVMPDGRHALLESEHATLTLWDLENDAELRRFEGHEDWITAVIVLPEGWRALSGFNDGTLRLWDLETGAELRRFEGHEDDIRSLSVLPDGRRALSGSDDNTNGTKH